MATTSRTFTFELSILTSIYFIWGFISSLNEILVPHLKQAFSLNYTEAMLVQFCFHSAYLFVALPAGNLVKRINYKMGICLGLITTSMGCLLFIPASNFASYPLFLIALFILASGITLLQVSANPYATLLGPPRTASSRLTLVQAFNSLGTTVGPYIGASLILATALPHLDTQSAAAQAASVKEPYQYLAGLLAVMAIIFAFFKLPPMIGKIPDEEKQPPQSITQLITNNKTLFLGMLGIFFYVGAEVAIGSFLVNYLEQPNIANLATVTAGKYLTFYWGGALIGRFIGAWVMQYIAPNKVLAFNALMAALLVCISLLSCGKLAMYSILAVGLFNSIMFPTIFSLAIKGLKQYTSQGSGALCLGIIGGSIIPLLQGALADQVGIQPAFVIPILCYVYIIYFAKASSTPAKR